MLFRSGGSDTGRYKERGLSCLRYLFDGNFCKNYRDSLPIGRLFFSVRGNGGQPVTVQHIKMCDGNFVYMD